MATATRERQGPPDVLARPEQAEMGEDGYPVRYELVNGELTPFSLKPYPVNERPLYWSFGGTGTQPLWLRSTAPNERGEHPIVQREAWQDSKYWPRNAWEEHVARAWLGRQIGGTPNLDEWRGVDHPRGPGYEWKCGTCSWRCGNTAAFEQHQRALSHDGMKSVKATE